MLAKPMDVLHRFPVRKTKAQKQSFRDAVQSYAKAQGYECTVEKGSFGCHNVIIGDPKTAKYLVTAHYDTPAGMLIPNLITPCNPVTFLAYQLFVVALFLLAAFAAGLPVMLLTKSREMTFMVAYLVYFGALFLMMLGPANKNNANDNTSGVVTVLEIMKSLPEMYRGKVCFVLFDLEEAGLVGSASYRKTHKAETENQIVLNLDCVGDGNELLFFPSKKLKRAPGKMAMLKRISGWYGEKHIGIREKGFSYYPSDQKNFPLGIGIAAFRRAKFVGLYCNKIHTGKDTILEETNVNILRACLTTLITCDAAE